jgi:PKHD-type hydroxylase
MIQIAHLLDPETVAALRAALGEGPFEDGRKTAGWHARLVKNNLQAGDAPLLKGVIRKIEAALAANEVFQAAALPRDIVSIMINRYDEGMEYGAHVDDALMHGKRTDVSFTIFLSAPEDYDGGDLVVSGMDAERAVKLPPGFAVVYPSGALHRVEKVTRGSRLAAVGWVRSLVRRPDQREILFDLSRSVKDVFEREGKSPLFDSLTQTRTRLLRMWAED